MLMPVIRVALCGMVMAFMVMAFMVMVGMVVVGMVVAVVIVMVSVTVMIMLLRGATPGRRRPLGIASGHQNSGKHCQKDSRHRHPACFADLRGRWCE